MVRITAGSHTIKKHNKMYKQAKGFRGLSSRSYIFAKEQVKQSLYDAYKSRKLKKRNFVNLWNSRISSFAKSKQFSYSLFLGGLKKLNILINKKVLSTLIVLDKVLINFLLNLVKNK